MVSIPQPAASQEKHPATHLSSELGGGERVSSSSSLLWQIKCCPHGDFLADKPRTAAQEYNQGSHSSPTFSFSYRHLWRETSYSCKTLGSALPLSAGICLSSLSFQIAAFFLSNPQCIYRKNTCPLSVSPQAINYLSPNTSFFLSSSLLPSTQRSDTCWL